MDSKIGDRKGTGIRMVAFVALALLASSAAFGQDCRLVERVRDADVYECCVEECDERGKHCELVCDDVALLLDVDDDAEFARLKWAAQMSFAPMADAEEACGVSCAASDLASVDGGGAVAIQVCCSFCEGSSCSNCSPETDNDSGVCTSPVDTLMDCTTDVGGHDYEGCSRAPTPPVS